ncbi:hypothetical protein ACAG24_025205 [Mycobacterium sp. pW049]|uniref:hypothetical protein n=1 Tax=[Mycobacterium] bulgaricum TaxID=3238985 RepID=UPI00351BAABC
MTNPSDDEADQDADDRSHLGKGDAGRGRDTPPPGPGSAPPTSAPPESFWTKNGVALAGIAAGVVTACAVSFFGYQTSIETQRAEREQSSIEFQREERKTAYSDFLAKALLLENVEDKVMTTEYRRPLEIDQQAIDNLNKSQALLADWQTASDQLTSAAAALDLVGSGNVRLRALDLLDAHHDVSFAYTDMALARSQMPPDQKAIDAAVEQFESKRANAAKVRFEFSQAASESLGISLLGP